MGVNGLRQSGRCCVTEHRHESGNRRLGGLTWVVWSPPSNSCVAWCARARSRIEECCGRSCWERRSSHSSGCSASGNAMERFAAPRWGGGRASTSQTVRRRGVTCCQPAPDCSTVARHARGLVRRGRARTAPAVSPTAASAPPTRRPMCCSRIAWVATLVAGAHREGARGVAVGRSRGFASCRVRLLWTPASLLARRSAANPGARSPASLWAWRATACRRDAAGMSPQTDH
jgi:hypothetical protein